jgi:hypothetical protein
MGDNNLNFKCSKEEHKQIITIAKRAIKLSEKNDITYSMTDCIMDITATHCNGTKINLKKLIEFNDSNFGHDVYGIRRYIDRNTGKLTNNFLPRCTEVTLPNRNKS